MASILTLSENELWLSLPENLTLTEIYSQVRKECKSLKHPVFNKDLRIKGTGTISMLLIIEEELKDSYKSYVIDLKTKLIDC
jgi:hypothetical protein